MYKFTKEDGSVVTCTTDSLQELLSVFEGFLKLSGYKISTNESLRLISSDSDPEALKAALHVAQARVAEMPLMNATEGRLTSWNNVNRFEVFTGTGRKFCDKNAQNVISSLQDDGATLRIFLD
jgi:hypothetical protein